MSGPTIETLELIGGHPAIDLANTVERGIPRPGLVNQDFLRAPDDLLTWLTRAGLAQPEETAGAARAWRKSPTATAENLRFVIEIREALDEILRAQLEQTTTTPAVRRALGVVQRHWLAAMTRARLAATPDSSGFDWVVGTDASWLPKDRVAATTVELLRSPELARLGRCAVEDGGCDWLFLDTTRNHSRRWCRMADCGTVSKSSRLTERRRARRAEARDGAPARS